MPSLSPSPVTHHFLCTLAVSCRFYSPKQVLNRWFCSVILQSISPNPFQEDFWRLCGSNICLRQVIMTALCFFPSCPIYSQKYSYIPTTSSPFTLLSVLGSYSKILEYAPKVYTFVCFLVLHLFSLYKENSKLIRSEKSVICKLKMGKITAAKAAKFAEVKYTKLRFCQHA